MATQDGIPNYFNSATITYSLIINPYGTFSRLEEDNIFTGEINYSGYCERNESAPKSNKYYNRFRNYNEQRQTEVFIIEKAQIPALIIQMYINGHVYTSIPVE
ncbi:hypothetical protein TcasGA2_TC008450 [Tribolium castaneum]|uniref:Uncharacterized protein n=1 Tax=Tribolium castaneum TaxID=7070 RepID=D2A226_TRICA|nr:hypothetical protein TcasGA2_TC008450 [Tribolium castaneum]